MRFGGIRQFLCVLGLMGLVLSGCSDPDPREPEPTASPTSTLTVPPPPEQANDDSPEGAAAFVTHYVDVFNYASNTGDVEELSRLSSPDCEGCQRYIDLYRDTYAAGGYFKGGEWKLSNVEVQTSKNQAAVFGHVASDAGRQREADNSPEIDGNAQDVDLTFIVEFGASPKLSVLEIQGSR